RPLIPAALGAYSALLAHAALDWDWEMPAVMLAGLFCAAAIVACAREPAPGGKLSRGARGGAFVVAGAPAVFALLAPTSRQQRPRGGQTPRPGAPAKPR